MVTKILKRYIKFLPGVVIAFIVIAIISWALIQEPIEPLDSGVQSGNSSPFYIPQSPING